jgi:hypothetical protein
MESFSDEQMARFEAWSRSGFNKNNVRKVRTQDDENECFISQLNHAQNSW